MHCSARGAASKRGLRAEVEVTEADDARLWHPWLRINRVRRVMLHARWSAEAWSAPGSSGRSRCGARFGVRVVQLTVARPRPPKKKSRSVQPQLPGMPPPQPAGTIRVLPMLLQIGDKLTDETSEWEIHRQTAHDERRQRRSRSRQEG